jgi:hypothetical protein
VAVVANADGRCAHPSLLMVLVTAMPSRPAAAQIAVICDQDARVGVDTCGGSEMDGVVAPQRVVLREVARMAHEDVVDPKQVEAARRDHRARRSP